MLTADNLKRLFRIYVYAGPRFSADVHPRHNAMPLTARRLDSGEYPVIYTSRAPYSPLGAANHVGSALKGRPALFLIRFSWTMRQPKAVHRLSTAMAVYQRRRPEHRIILLCNEEEERSAFAAAGAEAVLCSHNAFVDEETFKPAPEADRQFDAVHNAAMIPWKRHELAGLLGNCAHIFYKKNEYGHEETLSYLARLRSQMPHHSFINPVANGRIELMNSSGVNSVLNRSRCGLCLSAEEGAMLVSVEYLLAGLPVVSTPNVGGRDVFADPEFWLTVSDTREAVRDGVAEINGRNLSPDRIRARTLERVYEHRARLRSTVAEATGGNVVLPADLSAPLYRQKSVWISGATVAARLGIRRADDQ